MKKTLAITLTALFAILFVGNIGVDYYASYVYNRDIQSLWTLADRSSTLQAKSQYIDQYVTKLSSAHLEGAYSTVFTRKPQDSFDTNLQALESLQARLHEIQSVDPNSFAYQQAIQQITAQEQGEAQPMLDVFENTWYKVHFPLAYYDLSFIWFLAMVGFGLRLYVINWNE